jgi:hypothetical protein
MADDQRRTNIDPAPSDGGCHAHVRPADWVSAFRPDNQRQSAFLTRYPERASAMLQSHVIDIDGAFVGAAVRLDSGYRFVAIDMKLDDLDGSIWPTLADVQRLARRIYLAGRVPGPAPSHQEKRPD